jgi:hypothetical protein
LFEKPTVEQLAIAVVKIQAERMDSADVFHILADIELMAEEETNRRFTDDS